MLFLRLHKQERNDRMGPLRQVPLLRSDTLDIRWLRDLILEGVAEARGLFRHPRASTLLGWRRVRT